MWSSWEARDILLSPLLQGVDPFNHEESLHGRVHLIMQWLLDVSPGMIMDEVMIKRSIRFLSTVSKVIIMGRYENRTRKKERGMGSSSLQE